jgi:hypothetical protein
MYMAPEVQRQEPYSTSADMFSFAATVYELYSRSMLSFSQLPNNVVDLEARARGASGVWDAGCRKHASAAACATASPAAALPSHGRGCAQASL